MSYLLTEIALEMLGYKFYDIYGVQDEINNFQKQSTNERSSEIGPIETNLANLLSVNADSERNRKVNQNKEQIIEDVEASLPESLTKLMDSEYNKVRQQVLRNKPTDNQNANAQGFVQSFIEAEHKKLRMEQQNLRNFRKLVENNLLQINPATFEKYCQTFKPARKHLKRLDTNKK